MLVFSKQKYISQSKAYKQSYFDLYEKYGEHNWIDRCDGKIAKYDEHKRLRIGDVQLQKNWCEEVEE